EACDQQIATLGQAVKQNRITLGITIMEKYKGVSVFRLVTQATDAMKPLLVKYLTDLIAGKAQLDKLSPWQQYFLQLEDATAEVGNLGWLTGGGQEEDGVEPEDEGPSALPDPTGEVRSDAERSAQAQELAEITRYMEGLRTVGDYVEREMAHYD